MNIAIVVYAENETLFRDHGENREYTLKVYKSHPEPVEGRLPNAAMFSNGKILVKYAIALQILRSLTRSFFQIIRNAIADYPKLYYRFRTKHTKKEERYYQIHPDRL